MSEYVNRNDRAIVDGLHAAKLFIARAGDRNVRCRPLHGLLPCAITFPQLRPGKPPLWATRCRHLRWLGNIETAEIKKYVYDCTLLINSRLQHFKKPISWTLSSQTRSTRRPDIYSLTASRHLINSARKIGFC
jgi:hypothetical protein